MERDLVPLRRGAGDARYAYRTALSGAVVPGGIGVAPELDARLRSDDGAVHPARPAGADRRGERLWLCAAEPDGVDGPDGGGKCIAGRSA